MGILDHAARWLQGADADSLTQQEILESIRQLSDRAHALGGGLNMVVLDPQEVRQPFVAGAFPVLSISYRVTTDEVFSSAEYQFTEEVVLRNVGYRSGIERQLAICRSVQPVLLERLRYLWGNGYPATAAEPEDLVPFPSVR